MVYTICSLVYCILLFAPISAVQKPADAITGTWGRNGNAYLELKFDGKSTISGTAVWRGDEYVHRAPIKTGTFDPKTGAFKLEGDAKTSDGDIVAFLIEGTVEKDTVSGTFKLGERSGPFTFTRM